MVRKARKELYSILANKVKLLSCIDFLTHDSLLSVAKSIPYAQASHNKIALPR